MGPAMFLGNEVVGFFCMTLGDFFFVCLFFDFDFMGRACENNLTSEFSSTL